MVNVYIERPLYVFKILKSAAWDKAKGREFIQFCNEKVCTFAQEFPPIQ